eukprot:gene12925-9403_t
MCRPLGAADGRLVHMRIRAPAHPRTDVGALPWGPDAPHAAAAAAAQGGGQAPPPR